MHQNERIGCHDGRIPKMSRVATAMIHHVRGATHSVRGFSVSVARCGVCACALRVICCSPPRRDGWWWRGSRCPRSLHASVQGCTVMGCLLVAPPVMTVAVEVFWSSAGGEVCGRRQYICTTISQLVRRVGWNDNVTARAGRAGPRVDRKCVLCILIDLVTGHAWCPWTDHPTTLKPRPQVRSPFSFSQ